MSTTVIFVGVVVFAFIAGRLLQRFATRAFALTGIEYVLLGVLLGPFVLGVLDRSVLQALDLLVSVVLGVIGFLVGLEVWQRRAGTEPLLAGLISAAGVALSLAIMATGTIQWLDPQLLDSAPLWAEPLTATGETLVWLWISPEALWIGLTIGAAASTSSTVLLEVALGRFGVSPERAVLLRTMASSAQLIAVFTFGMAMAGSRATSASGELGLTIVEWGTITIVAGGFTGLLFSIFLGREDDPMRLLVAAVGVIAFAAGIGMALGVSPLFTNLVAGLALALTSTHADRLDEALRPLRLPCAVMVLLLAGATWVPAAGWYWMLVPGYILTRTLARLVLSRIAVSTFTDDAVPSRGIGRALLGQGVLASAISLAFAHQFPELAGPVTTTILGGIILTDLFALGVMRRYLADTGEMKALDPDPPQDPGADTDGSEAHA